MILFKKSTELKSYLAKREQEGLKTGFVPTMGALHPGHLSLIQTARQQAGTTVCSIFVNPTQFNDQNDFRKYPVTIEQDIYLLEKNGVDILFLPGVDEIYPGGTTGLEQYDLGYLETILEGKYRPGHFQGVCQVMHRLLTIVQPDLLFMGQKDYQQCMVIKKMISDQQMKPVFYTCPTLRETDGLAMSSRNMRLNETERKNAAAIFKALVYIKEHIITDKPADVTRAAELLLSEYDFKTDYVAIAGADDLQIINEWDGRKKCIALIAAFQHEVRLIDNMILNDEH